MGVCGLRFEDFCLLTPFEFQAVMDAYGENERQQSRDMWECMRVLAAVNVSPFSKTRVNPRNLLKFPWDGETDRENRKARKPVGKEEDKSRLMSLMNRIKK